MALREQRVWGVRERLFEPFVSAAPEAGGTGLGLAIVKGFAEAMGLTVKAANNSDPLGAIFTIHLPADAIISGIDVEDIA